MIPMTTHKAWAAAAAGFVVPVLTYLAAWLLSANAWEWRPFLAAVVGSALTSLGAGGSAWAVPNRPKITGEHTQAAVALENSHTSNMAG